jgi:hypothetical protein
LWEGRVGAASFGCGGAAEDEYLGGCGEADQVERWARGERRARVTRAVGVEAFVDAAHGTSVVACGLPLGRGYDRR